MIKAMIIDDEINGVESLIALIRENCSGITISSGETDPVEAISRIKEIRPDLLFLDIQMPGMSGFELLEQVKEVPLHVIFTTAYDQYAVKAFRSNAVDYLLKPVIVSELVEAVEKVSGLLKNNDRNAFDVGSLLEKIRQQQGKGRLAVTSMNEIIYIDCDQISRLESDSNYTNIFLLDGRRINSTRTLKDYESLLDPTVFFRVFKTHIVNLRQVKKFVKSDGGYLVMTDETQVPVSREKKQALLDLLTV